MTFARALRAASALAWLALSTPALAQTGDAGIASQLFDDGRDLMKKGDFVAACPKLSESARLEPRVGTLARLAECEEKIGHLASARGHWKDAVDLAKAQKDDRATHAEDELKRVDAMTPRVTLSMKAGVTPPPGFAIQLDQVSIGTEALGMSLPVDPGHHTIAASAPNRAAWSTSVDTRADGATTPIEIPDLAPAGSIANPAQKPPDHTVPTPLPPPPVQTKVTHPLRPVGLITAGVGVAALAVGSIAGLVANSQANKSYDEGCQTSGKCPPGEAASDHNSARTTATVSTIAFVAGGVLVAAGVTLFIVAPKKEEPVSTALYLTPTGLAGTW